MVFKCICIFLYLYMYICMCLYEYILYDPVCDAVWYRLILVGDINDLQRASNYAVQSGSNGPQHGHNPPAREGTLPRMAWLSNWARVFRVVLICAEPTFYIVLSCFIISGYIWIKLVGGIFTCFQWTHLFIDLFKVSFTVLHVKTDQVLSYERQRTCFGQSKTTSTESGIELETWSSQTFPCFPLTVHGVQLLKINIRVSEPLARCLWPSVTNGQWFRAENGKLRSLRGKSRILGRCYLWMRSNVSWRHREKNVDTVEPVNVVCITGDFTCFHWNNKSQSQRNSLEPLK